MDDMFYTGKSYRWMKSDCPSEDQNYPVKCWTSLQIH